MSNFEKCGNCGKWAFLDRHVCLPEWEAARCDNEEFIEKSFGYDAQSAAERYVEDNFSFWEYPESVEVMLRKPGETEWQKFYVEVEMEPSFSAKRM